jgi:hypothetical protein
MRKTTPRQDIFTILGMVGTLGLPAMLTLSRVSTRPESVHGVENPSPLGYTVSLSLFLLPVIVLTIFHMYRPRHHTHRSALLAASGVIAVLGFTLDTFFGHAFFTFKNEAATLGIRLPAWDWTTLSWVRAYLPVEEFAFYILGALFTITVYLWFSEYWLQDYEPHEYEGNARAVGRLIQVSWPSLLLWTALLAIGLAFKRVGPQPDGFAGYFVFLMVLGFLPTFLFLRPIAAFVNWRAFAGAYASLMLVSLVWEATLGVPYDWWNYKHQQMLGIDVEAWSGLPLEAVLLWLVIAWDCVIAFEIFRVFFHMDQPVMKALFGKSASARAGGEAT